VLNTVHLFCHKTGLGTGAENGRVCGIFRLRSSRWGRGMAVGWDAYNNIRCRRCGCQGLAVGCCGCCCRSYRLRWVLADDGMV